VISTASGKVCYISSLGGVRATRSGSCSACVACATATVAFSFLVVSALIRLILLAIAVVFPLHLQTTIFGVAATLLYERHKD